MLPTRSTRRAFLEEYLKSYNGHAAATGAVDIISDLESEIEKLFADVDRFRGLPGFYWGIWALIQATVSQIDFDYASYAEVRLGEYWAWRGEENKMEVTEGKEQCLRERRWAKE